MAKIEVEDGKFREIKAAGGSAVGGRMGFVEVEVRR